MAFLAGLKYRGWRRYLSDHHRSFGADVDFLDEVVPACPSPPPGRCTRITNQSTDRREISSHRHHHHQWCWPWTWSELFISPINGSSCAFVQLWNDQNAARNTRSALQNLTHQWSPFSNKSILLSSSCTYSYLECLKELNFASTEFTSSKLTQLLALHRV